MLGCTCCCVTFAGRKSNLNVHVITGRSKDGKYEGDSYGTPFFGFNYKETTATTANLKKKKQENNVLFYTRVVL